MLFEALGVRSSANPASEAIPTFGDLFEAHAPFVMRSVRHLGARDADVLDLTQEVFLVAYDKRASLVRPEGVRSWLYRIAFGVVRNHQRRAQVRREVPTDAPALDTVTVTPADPVERAQNRTRLLRVLGELDETKRAVLVAHVIEEIPIKEVAAALGIPLKTAYSRLYAARREAAAAFARDTVPHHALREGDDDGRT